MVRNIRTFMAMMLPILAFALTPGAASAQSYSGNWPITISHSQSANGTYCVTLTDDGEFGWPHSGPASVNGFGDIYGEFQLINGMLVVTIQVVGSGEELASVLFTARASGGHIGKGVYETAQGAVTDSGALVFGAKGGCSN